MCKVVEFPMQKRIPKELKDRIYGAAKDYIDVIYDALDYLDVDEDDSKGIEDVNRMLAEMYTEALVTAVEEKE